MGPLGVAEGFALFFLPMPRKLVWPILELAVEEVKC